ncbi:MAG: glutamate racemase [Bacteroidota bacterium]|jgi:glutamate racemase
MSKKSPIGVFDSGYGGLTILSEIRKRLPEYDFLYLGDNARAPYGNRSFEIVYEYTLEAVKLLFEQGCHLVILACNTASAKALRSIQQQDLPTLAPQKRVLGVIRPSTEEIGLLTATKHVGILATEGTVQSKSYELELQKFAPDIIVNQHACPLWVPLIENHKHNSEAGKKIISEDLFTLLAKDSKIDTIVLGCTHYPLVQNYLETLVESKIKIVSQGAIVADKLALYLQNHPEIDLNCSKNGTIKYWTTEESRIFDQNAASFLGIEIQSKSIHY